MDIIKSIEHEQLKNKIIITGTSKKYLFFFELKEEL